MVLDEVHFLQDPYRGGVWEEVLVLCPAEVRFVCLSATVTNANELGGWLRSVRGATTVVVERHRPIVLRHHFAVYRREDEGVPVPAPAGQRAARSRGPAHRPGGAASPAGRALCPWQGRGRGPRLPFRAPGGPRWSRSSAASRCCRPSSSSSAGPPATTPCARCCATACVSPTRRSGPPSARWSSAASSPRRRRSRVLGYDEWLEGLEAGRGARTTPGSSRPSARRWRTASPPACSKVVFATETLSLGINMPARSVVIERFTKYGGAGRATLTSGEYLQLTGRAGRRGLD